MFLKLHKILEAVILYLLIPPYSTCGAVLHFLCTVPFLVLQTVFQVFPAQLDHVL